MSDILRRGNPTDHKACAHATNRGGLAPDDEGKENIESDRQGARHLVECNLHVFKAEIIEDNHPEKRECDGPNGERDLGLVLPRGEKL
jgi:hypothetical protein